MSYLCGRVLTVQVELLWLVLPVLIYPLLLLTVLQ